MRTLILAYVVTIRNGAQIVWSKYFANKVVFLRHHLRPWKKYFPSAFYYNIYTIILGWFWYERGTL